MKGHCKHSQRAGLTPQCLLGLNPKHMAQEACAPGEDYKEGLYFRIPCVSREHIIKTFSTNPKTLKILDQQATCSSYCELTDDEIQAKEKDFETAFLNINRARNAIVKQIEESGRNCGRIPCPICGSGQLSYSRASYNGHIHGQCTTKDCVAWRE